jgi:FKBP-type peptidyl-prolyl cis-trans isomerase 2
MTLEFTLSTEDEIWDAATAERPFRLTKTDSKIPEFLMSRLELLGKGEKFSWTLSPELAFGKVNKDLKIELDLLKVPEKMKSLEVGDYCEFVGPDKKLRPFKIVLKDSEKILLDGNSPLAGQIIFFEGCVLDKR